MLFVFVFISLGCVLFSQLSTSSLAKAQPEIAYATGLRKDLSWDMQQLFLLTHLDIKCSERFGATFFDLFVRTSVSWRGRF
jgi:hypothetical protein